MTKPVVPSLQVSGKVDCLTFQLPSSFLSFLEKKKTLERIKISQKFQWSELTILWLISCKVFVKIGELIVCWLQRVKRVTFRGETSLLKISGPYLV